MNDVRRNPETEYEPDNQPQDAGLDQALKAAMARQSCPDTMTLADYQAGWLEQRAGASIEHHLARCQECQAELSRLTQFLTVEASEAIAAPRWQPGSGFEWQLRAAGRTIIRLLGDALVPPQPQFAAIATKGRTGDDDPALIRQIVVTPEEIDDLDLQVIVRREAAEADTCLVQIRAEIPSQWPELAGTQISVTAGEWQAQGETDDDGQLTLTGLPLDRVDQLLVEVGASAE